MKSVAKHAKSFVISPPPTLNLYSNTLKILKSYTNSRLAFALDVLRHEEVLAIPDNVGELRDPVAKHEHTRLFRQLEVDLDVAVTIDEIVDVGVVLDILLGEEDEVFAALTHVGELFAIGTLQTTLLGPVQAEPHAPAGMEGREGPLTGAVVEDALEQLETLGGIAQTVAMRQEEDLAIEFGGLRLLVEDDATLLFEILISPDVVVARKVMHLDTHVGEFRDLAQETGEALGHYIFVFVPEVEHVT